MNSGDRIHCSPDESESLGEKGHRRAGYKSTFFFLQTFPAILGYTETRVLNREAHIMVFIFICFHSCVQ